MKRMIGKRVKVGDVVEIPTPEGLAYAQYTHKEAMHGALLRVFPGLHTERPRNLKEVVNQTPQFSTFFPLQAAVNRGGVTVVDNLAVSQPLQEFPVFRVPMQSFATGKIEKWWLWNGDDEWPVGDLTPEQRRMPIREVWNDTLLVERIVAGWTPETDAE